MQESNLRPILIEQFHKVRQLSLQICAPLEPEDYVIQSSVDVSPPKWHLAHTTWFFELFLLSRFDLKFKPFNSSFYYLFNSYYASQGAQLERIKRGVLSRPSLLTVLEYRKNVDTQTCSLIESCPNKLLSKLQSILALGLNHEEQHQELLITDIKHNLWSNPVRPIFTQPVFGKNDKLGLYSNELQLSRLNWIEFDGGLKAIGAMNETFAYDHERPRHEIFLRDYHFSSRLVTNEEYCEFIESGGYSKPDLWLSQGWDTIRNEGWSAPLYWEKSETQWWVATLNGMEPINPAEPVSHVSFFEADAYARWKGARLPTEAEWEVAAQSLPPSAIEEGNFLNTNYLRARPSIETIQALPLRQMFGDLWEWTASAYLGSFR